MTIIFTEQVIEAAAIGAIITVIVSIGSIFEWIRSKLSILQCPLCSGFWIGIAYAIIMHESIMYVYLTPFDIFNIGILSSIFAFILYNIIQAFFGITK